MRFLLLSDTHGKLGVINDLAAEVGADAVIHAGDFGFYDVPVSVIFDTGAKLSYLDRTLIEGFPFAGTREDFFPGLGTFESDTFETPFTLGNHSVTITTGALTTIPAMALGLVAAQGILGSALFDHFTAGYSPRRGEFTLVRFPSPSGGDRGSGHS